MLKELALGGACDDSETDLSKLQTREVVGDGAVDIRGCPSVKSRTGNWKACWLIFGSFPSMRLSTEAFMSRCLDLHLYTMGDKLRGPELHTTVCGSQYCVRRMSILIRWTRRSLQCTLLQSHGSYFELAGANVIISSRKGKPNCSEEAARSSSSVNCPSSYDYSPNQLTRSLAIETVCAGCEVSERVAFYAISSNLVIYLTTVLHEDISVSARNVNNWCGTTFMTPLIGAFIADAYLGRYLTLATFSCGYFLVSFHFKSFYPDGPHYT